MEFMDVVYGVAEAVFELIGWVGVGAIVVVGGFLYVTRRRPGRRYDDSQRPEPVDRDRWGGLGL